MSGNYEDIIHLPHHVSSSRKRMSMIDRAAQFSPFAALTGYDAAIQETGRLTDQYIELDVDAQKSLNEKLSFLTEFVPEQPEITVTWFVPDDKKLGGSYIQTTGKVIKIDFYHQMILLEDDITIHFDRIYDINSDLFFKDTNFFE